MTRRANILATARLSNANTIDTDLAATGGHLPRRGDRQRVHSTGPAFVGPLGPDPESAQVLAGGRP